MKVLERAALFGVMPVINIPRPELAVPLADALTEGGLPQIEVTLRNDTALDSIRAIRAERPDMVVGAGTVLSVEQAKSAAGAGAQFIVTPGYNPAVVNWCIENGVEILPGCVTPAEIETGMAAGLDTFKFFPAESLGGVKAIKALRGPYRNVRFVPTSGISMDNIASYLACDGVACVGGSFMAPAALLEAGDFAAVTALCREAVRRALGFTLRHVGVNADTPEEGERMAQRFSQIFGVPYLPGGRSDFSGTWVEWCKDTFPGAAGHIAIGTPNIARAAAYLERSGVELRQDFRNYDKAGNLVCIYLKETFAGFAVHIVKV